MRARDPLEPVAWVALAGVLAWAAWGALGRAGELLASQERTHAAIALVAWPLLLGGLALRVRSVLRPGPARESAWEDLRRQFAKSRAATAGLMAAGVLAALAVEAPFIAPFDWSTIDVGPQRLPPSPGHWFGTDEFGRDVFSRCLYGARISLTVGFVAVSISATVGTVVGACAGYFGGWIDRGLMFLTDLLLALPRLVLLLAVLGLFRFEGPQRVYFIVAMLGATGWMGVARIVRAQILSLKEQDFVAAAVSLGLPPARVLGRHLIPNALAPVIVYASLALGSTILTEASLSFLGLGVPPPTPTWGVMVTDAKQYLTSAPWIAVFPGLLILWAVMCFNLVGDGLRDALDPKLRGRA
ncbi:MAG: ABC transporter permease [Myxococcota bacterium]